MDSKPNRIEWTVKPRIENRDQEHLQEQNASKPKGKHQQKINNSEIIKPTTKDGDYNYK